MEKKLNVVTGAKGYVGYALVKELADRGELKVSYVKPAFGKSAAVRSFDFVK